MTISKKARHQLTSSTPIATPFGEVFGKEGMTPDQMVQTVGDVANRLEEMTLANIGHSLKALCGQDVHTLTRAMDRVRSGQPLDRREKSAVQRLINRLTAATEAGGKPASRAGTWDKQGGLRSLS